jgi:hypothetical protein
VPAKLCEPERKPDGRLPPEKELCPPLEPDDPADPEDELPAPEPPPLTVDAPNAEFGRIEG